MSNILIVLSAADSWTRADGSAYATGVWAEEVVDIDETFAQAGVTVDIATPGGVRSTIDPHSVNPEIVGPDNADRFLAYLRSIEHRLAAPLALADIVTGRYDVIVIPGGHGPVEDLHKDADMGRVIAGAQSASTIIAPVCHGQAALLAAKDGNGNWLFAGRRMTAFSEEEEVEFGTADNAPWLLADTLRQRGARYEQEPNWEPFLVRDGNLLTGQSPASSKPLAEAVIVALN